jgi:6-phosphogluconate dehydrogenase
MRIGMVGLGRMGANLTRRLMRDGHVVVVHDLDADAVRALAGEGAVGAASLDELVAALPAPRVVWVMVPAGAPTESAVTELAARMHRDDVVIDGGNTFYRDDVRRAEALAERGVRYADVGTSGGVFGLERGYSLMVGAEPDVFALIEPVLRSLAPGVDAAERTLGATGEPSQAEQGYLHCGAVGTGHFVKMVHNGIEYGLMAAYAEGLNLIRAADVEVTAIGDVAEVWRRGSVVSSWLLDLTAAALRVSPELSQFEGRVNDSGEGRWTAAAAIEAGVPTPVMTAALYSRFASRGNDDFANRVLSAMRNEFGGHVETPR